MVKVAVLGGSGHVGKTIVDVLRDNPAHSVVVLSRKVGFPDSMFSPIGLKRSHVP